MRVINSVQNETIKNIDKLNIYNDNDELIYSPSQDLYNLLLHLANTKLVYDDLEKIGDGSVVTESDFTNQAFWGSEYVWDYENTWLINSAVNKGLPFLRAFVDMSEFNINIIVNGENNCGIILNLVQNDTIIKQYFIMDSQSITMEAITNEKFIVVISRAYSWTMTCQGSGVKQGSSYALLANEETHTITINAVSKNFNNAIVV